MKVILENSIFSREDFSDIFESHFKSTISKNEFGFYNQTQGTIIFIYNLRKLEGSENSLELDLESDFNDIKLNTPENDSTEHDNRVNSILANFNSLREYVQVLYLSLNKTLKHDKKSALSIKIGKKEIEGIYDSQFSKQKTYQFKASGKDVTMIIGQDNNHKNKLSNFNTFIYHKNRLIECLQKLKCKIEFPMEVKSIVIADFLIPMHNKQSFERNADFNNLKNQILTYERKYIDANYAKNLSTKNLSTKIIPPDISSLVQSIVEITSKQQLPNTSVYNATKNRPSPNISTVQSIVRITSKQQQLPNTSVYNQTKIRPSRNSNNSLYRNLKNSLIRLETNENDPIFDERNNGNTTLNHLKNKNQIKNTNKKNETKNTLNHTTVEDILGDVSSSTENEIPRLDELEENYNENYPSNLSPKSVLSPNSLPNVSTFEPTGLENTSPPQSNIVESYETNPNEYPTIMTGINLENEMVVRDSSNQNNEEELSIRDCETNENYLQNFNSPESEYISAGESDIEYITSNTDKESYILKNIKRENTDSNDINTIKRIKTEPVSGDEDEEEESLVLQLKFLYDICLKYNPKLNSIQEFKQQYQKCMAIARKTTQ